MKLAPELASEVGAAFWKATPPTAVAVATTTGAIDPQWFVIVPTALYVVLQAAYLIWKWRREARSK